MAKKEYDEICSACKLCGGTNCFALQDDIEKTAVLPDNKLVETYDGLRFTSDAMDCSLPIAIDSHSGCSFNCLYCFANNLQRAPDRNPTKIQKAIREGSFYSEWSIRKLERFLDRSLTGAVPEAMYPLLDAKVPIQLGALGDPADDLEDATGWLLKAIPLFIKYKIPVRVGTKGARILLKKKYRKAFEKSPEQFWFAFSIISNSDDIISKIDINAPVTSERLKAMKVYSDMGASCSIRFRPFMPGISDAYPGEPEAWAVLMERAAEAGARAISFEYIFLNSALTDRQKAMYQLMFRVQRDPKFGDYWNSLSNPKESCRRGTREYKYKMTMDIRKKAHELGMVFGCSDPHFKEFNDYGSCCGMPSDDPWFGNWSRRQLTNVIVEMRNAYVAGKPMKVSYTDWAPEWAHRVLARTMIAYGTWHSHRIRRMHTFGDSMRNKWNNPGHPRSPYTYFAGVMRPIGVEEGTKDLIYEYRDWHEGFDRMFRGEPNVQLISGL